MIGLLKRCWLFLGVSYGFCLRIFEGLLGFGFCDFLMFFSFWPYYDISIRPA